MKFKSTESLFAKIKEDFTSFDAASLLDDGRFHKDVKYIISLLGIKWYREAETMLDICNYRADMPSDFYLLESAWVCDACPIGEIIQNGVVLRKLTFDHIPSVCEDTHDFTCEPRSSSTCIFNRQEEILVQRNNIIQRYRNPVLLKPGNVSTRKCCSSTCQNLYSTCTDTFSIQNEKFYVNFKDGNIFLHYTAFPYDDDTGYPMIPDNDIIEKCIEYFIKSNILENLWINGEGDLERRYIAINQLYLRYLGQAQYETKLPSFASMVHKARLNKKSLNIYQI